VFIYAATLGLCLWTTTYDIFAPLVYWESITIVFLHLSAAIAQFTQGVIDEKTPNWLSNKNMVLASGSITFAMLPES